MKRNIFILATALICASATNVTAEPIEMTMVLSPVENIRIPFKDGTGHFVLLEQRQGR